MSATFHTIEHTADIGVEVEAAGVSELFEGAATAMFSLMADISGVRRTERRNISLAASDHVELMFRWLNELLYISDADEMLFSGFSVTVQTVPDGGVALEADVSGEPMDDERHVPGEEIKAATYHELAVSSRDGLWSARIIFDV
jgi:SHS2 domain-containing protein